MNDGVWLDSFNCTSDGSVVSNIDPSIMADMRCKTRPRKEGAGQWIQCQPRHFVPPPLKEQSEPGALESRVAGNEYVHA